MSHRIVEHEEWVKARQELLVKEKELTPSSYRFPTAKGSQSQLRETVAQCPTQN